MAPPQLTLCLRHGMEVLSQLKEPTPGGCHPRAFWLDDAGVLQGCAAANGPTPEIREYIAQKKLEKLN